MSALVFRTMMVLVIPESNKCADFVIVFHWEHKSVFSQTHAPCSQLKGPLNALHYAVYTR